MDRRNSTLYRNGEKGDQDIRWSQNATLADSDRNNVGIHLFEVIDAGDTYIVDELNWRQNHIWICNLMKMGRTEKCGFFLFG